MKNVQDIISAFGGVRPAAYALGIAPTTVQHWKSKNRIPEWRIDHVIRCAREKGVSIDINPSNPD